MFREASTQIPTSNTEPVWPVLNRDAPPAAERSIAPQTEQAPFRAAPAIPDVPAAVGTLLFGTYLALIGALALATAAPGVSSFVLVIAALFVVAFFTIPHFILAQEPREGRQSSMDQFLARGMDTFTGHCDGKAALVQMFVVPVLLTLGVLLIAMVIAFG